MNVKRFPKMKNPAPIFLPRMGRELRSRFPKHKALKPRREVVHNNIVGQLPLPW